MAVNDSVKENRGLDEAIAGMNNMRGLMALWIVLGHLGMNMNMENRAFLLMQRFDLAIVGVFFFLSGYGLEKSFRNKKDYLRSIVIKKIPRLFIMTIVQYFLTIGCFLLFHYRYEGEGLISEYIKSLNWYMWELAVLYLVFFISHMLFKNVKAFYLAGILSAALMITVFLVQGPYAGCFSGMAFPAGMIICGIKKKAEEFIDASYIRSFLIVLSLLIISGLLVFLPQSSFVALIWKNLFSVVFALFAALIFLKTDIRSRILRFLAAMSPEIYLYQFTAAGLVSLILYRRNDLNRGLVFAACSFVLTFVMALAVYAIRTVIEKQFHKSR